MHSKYLYFPSCSIINADKINLSKSKIILHIRSNIITPSQYPKHSVLQGKAEFIFTLHNDLLEKNRDLKNCINDILNVDLENLKNIKKLKKKNISVIAFFNEKADISLETMGLGKENQICTFTPFDNGKEVAKASYLEYILTHKKSSPSGELIKI